MQKVILIFLATFSVATFASKGSDSYYQWPIYDESAQLMMREHLSGKDFNSWNLGGLYTDVPMDIAKSMGAKYGIFCSSGTAGLHAALMALGLKPKDKVAVPAMTFVRAVTPLAHLGLAPVLVDVEKDTGNIALAALKELKDPQIKAVVAVHMWGVPCDIAAIKELCDQRGWFLIEDFSHAHYSESNAGFAGAVGDVGYASLQRKKTFAVGEGGLIITQKEAVFKRLQDITSPGSFNNTPGKATDYSGFGLNMRMAPTAAILAKSLFAKKDEMLALRSGSAEMLRDMMQKFPNVFQLDPIPQHVKRVSWYALRFKTSFSEDQLNKAAQDTRWRFTDIAYAPIYDESFWNKSGDFFPFSHMIKPQRIPAPGLGAYMQGRLGVKIPNLAPKDWTKEEQKKWLDDLALISSRLQALKT